MRISDWSSDVCSSDLFGAGAAMGAGEPAEQIGIPAERGVAAKRGVRADRTSGAGERARRIARDAQRDRKSVVEGKSVSGRVDPGGSRFNKKKLRSQNDTLTHT